MRQLCLALLLLTTTAACTTTQTMRRAPANERPSTKTAAHTTTGAPPKTGALASPAQPQPTPSPATPRTTEQAGRTTTLGHPSCPFHPVPLAYRRAVSPRPRATRRVTPAPHRRRHGALFSDDDPAPRPIAQDDEAHRRTVRTALVKRLQRCYETSLKRDPHAGGAVTIGVIVRPDGSVGHAGVIESSLRPEAVACCLVRVFQRATFPNTSGTPAFFTQRFVFTNGP